MLSTIIYMITGINGKEGITCLQARIDILRCFQMICICTGSPSPAFLEHAPCYIIQHLLWIPACSPIFTDRLLSENWCNASTYSPQCPDMSRCRQSQSISHSDRCL